MCCRTRPTSDLPRGVSWEFYIKDFQEELKVEYCGLSEKIEKVYKEAIDKSDLEAIKVRVEEEYSSSGEASVITPKASVVSIKPSIHSLSFLRYTRIPLPRVLPIFPRNRVVLDLFLDLITPTLEKELGVFLKPLRNVNIVTLVYLKNAYSASPSHVTIPFTKDFILACNASRIANDRADKYLLCHSCIGWRGWTLVVAAALTSVAMTIPYNMIDESIDPKLVAILIPIITAIGVVVGASLGMDFTGLKPHEASVSANIERTEIDNLAKLLNGAARELVTLYYSPIEEERDLASRLASQIDTIRLREDYRKITLQKHSDNEVLLDLEDAIDFIKTDTSAREIRRFVFKSKEMEDYIREARLRYQAFHLPRKKEEGITLSDLRGLHESLYDAIIDVERTRSQVTASSSDRSTTPPEDYIAIPIMPTGSAKV